MNYLKAFFLLVAFVSPLAYANDYKEVSWDDLMPEDWAPAEVEEADFFEGETYEGLDMDLPNTVLPNTEIAPIVQSLDGKNLKLPGYIIPIKFNVSSVTEFLLVPYVGACIHTPPPPENQIVYVSLKKPYLTTDMWAPVWVSGLMKAQLSMTEFATAGYHLTEASAEVYEY